MKLLLNKEDIIRNLIKKIDSVNKRKSQLFHYYYAFMLELKDGGISLVDVGSNDFFKKNWYFMQRKHKEILLKIYELFLYDIEKFNQLLIEIGKLINDDFAKWVEIPWFRFLTIKSLHDSNIVKINFNEIKQELTCIIKTKNAINLIPFNDVIEITFQTHDFNPNNIYELITCVENNASIIYDINPYFIEGNLVIDLAYECFIDHPKNYDLPELNFKCINIQIKIF